MKTMKKVKITGLYKIKKSDREKVYHTYLKAFQDYPKLMNAFPGKRERFLALEATIRYYVAYDLTYGAGFSLDKNIHEAVVLVHSDDMKYTFLKHLAAGSYSKEYKKVMNQLSKKDRATRVALFEELDKLETTIDIPTPHIYLDFLGTKPEFQGQGRGRKLMEHICQYADSVCLPIMLFTNTAEDVKFYESLGFKIIGITSSEKFGFTNTYLVYGA